MAYSTDLFDLIKSLDRTEKAYFKKFGYKSDKNSLYLQLFDAIDKQKEYDEKKLLKKFRGKSIARQFSASKNYLYGLVLNSMCEYDAQKNISIKATQYVREIEALRKRNLTEQATKKIEAALKFAYDNDLYEYIVVFLNVKLNMLPFRLDTNSTRMEVVRDIKQAIDLQKDVLNYSDLYSQTQLLEAEIGLKVRNEEERLACKKLLQNPLLQNEEDALSFLGKYYFHNVQQQVYRILGDYEAAYQHIKRIVELFDLHSKYKQLKPSHYAVALEALLIARFSTKREDKIHSTLALLEQEMEKEYGHLKIEERANRKLYCRPYTILVHHYFISQQYAKALPLIPKLTKEYELIEVSEPAIAVLVRYISSATYFYCGQFEQALDEINLVLEHPHLATAEDYATFSRILNLFIHYELGNELLLEYAVRSTYRFLYRRKRLYQFETLLLKFLKKASKLSANEDIRLLFEELLQDCLQLAEHPFEQKAFVYFNVLDWLRSKIEGKAMLEVMK